MVAMPGLAMGTTTRNNVEYSPLPSMVAASISSRGTLLLKKERITMMLKGLTSRGTIKAA